ncbi:MAG TPA: type II toxin-antitoxin system RelE/ParE family toxin [Verrucomicrobiae bacterium]
MAAVIFSAQAEEDLASITDYIAADNPDAALNLLSEIQTKVFLYSRTPELGKKADHLRAGLRYFIKGNYLIFYRSNKGVLEVVRVLHGAQNLPELF